MRTRKTFTGCWTCRRRRLKCDETRPACLQCLSKHVFCEGYSAKLQWLRPNALLGSRENTQSSQKDSRGRRFVSASRPTQWSERDIETALVNIDKTKITAGNAVNGPFSVFRLQSPDKPSKTHVIEVGPCLTGNDYAILEHPPLIASSDIENAVGAESYHSPETAPFHLGRNSNEAGGLAGCLLPIDSVQCGGAGPLDRVPHSGTPATQSDTQSNGDHAISVRSGHTETVMSRIETPEEQLLAYGSVFDGTPGEEGFLTPDVKYLIRNYVENVLPILSHVGHVDTPWARFHIPRALQCSSELEIFGHAPESRQALLHTALCISAYNKYHFCLSSGQDEQVRKWLSIAASYKGRAFRTLETCLRGSAVDSVKSDFDEILGAMLAMVTIDVISGDMETCALHLQACESLIQDQLPKRSTDVSDVTRGLFTIFLYLRTIQEATTLFCQKFPEASQSAPQGAKSCSLEEVAKFFSSQKRQPKFAWWSCEVIYGFPQSLLLLLRKATGLLQATYRQSDHLFGGLLNNSLESTLDELEDEILQWPVEDVVKGLGTAPMSHEMILIIQHSTRVLHQAIIIFCCRKIRKVHQKVVEPYVRSLISHLEQIEMVKEKSGLRTGYMLWPAFVAGSQTTNPDLQARFLRWFDMVDKVGQGSSKVSKDVLVDVWRCNSDNIGMMTVGAVHLILT